MFPLATVAGELTRNTEIPAGLVSAICLVESSGDQWAWNPEPRYRYLVDALTLRPFRRLTKAEGTSEKPPADFSALPGLSEDVDAEWWGQQASWGPMQVMGALARELGFDGHFPQLCDPYVGMAFGIAQLRQLRKRYNTWDSVIAAYNAGSARFAENGQFVNQGYVDKVRGYWPAHEGAE